MEKCRAGEKRAKGFLYFVKGDNLDIWKTPMKRRGK